MYVRFPRAAVAAGVNGEDHRTRTAPLPGRRQEPPPRSPAYWASKAFETRRGRLIGFRITEVPTEPDGKMVPIVQVALVANGSDSYRWVNAEGVGPKPQPLLSELAARWWLQTSTFKRR
jgi:hypothetical protein